MEKKILIIDEDKNYLDKINSVLTKEGFKVSCFQNPKEAYENFEKEQQPVILTDIFKPLNENNDIINNIDKYVIKPVIFICTSDKDPETVLYVMKKGVTDVIYKPLNYGELILKIKNNYETFDLRRNKTVLEKEKIIRLESQLEWFNWKDRILQKDIKQNEKNLFENMHRSFTQGNGFGNMISIGKMLVSLAKEENNNIIINSGVFNVFKKSIETSESIINQLFEIKNIFAEDMEYENMHYKEFYKFLKDIINDLKKYEKVKGQKLIYNEYKEYRNMTIKINKIYIDSVIRELLINAMKFSQKRSNIIILTELSNNELVIDFISMPDVNITGKKEIPLGYENLIFEPFFRLSKNVYEEFNTLDFGLGLTKAESIVKKHNGRITVMNIVDYTEDDKEAKNKVDFKCYLPAEKFK